MQLYEVMQQRFGDLDKATLRQIVMAMKPCISGIHWFDDEFNGDFGDVSFPWLVWFSRPFLCEADLREANLRFAHLRLADMRRADLRGGYLRFADLRGADLCFADLRGVDDVRGADMRGAILCSADLRGAYLRGVNIRGADLRGARYNKFTRFPDGFDPVVAKMVLDE